MGDGLAVSELSLSEGQIESIKGTGKINPKPGQRASVSNLNTKCTLPRL